MTHRTALASLLAATAFCAGAQEASPEGAQWVGRFGQDLSPWREVRLGASLKPNAFELREWDGVSALVVTSRASMSLMARPLEIDLTATPVLCWRWRIDAPVAGADMTRRSGDDYAARVYVSLRIPEADKSLALRAQLRVARALWSDELPDAALNYVWDNRQRVGTERPNAYTGRTMMVVMRSGESMAGRWVWERRHVGRDAARLFTPSARAVQIAVTADTDNTGESARAGFADLHFVPESTACSGPP